MRLAPAFAHVAAVSSEDIDFVDRGAKFGEPESDSGSLQQRVPKAAESSGGFRTYFSVGIA